MECLCVTFFLGEEYLYTYWHVEYRTDLRFSKRKMHQKCLGQRMFQGPFLGSNPTCKLSSIITLAIHDAISEDVVSIVDHWLVVRFSGSWTAAAQLTHVRNVNLLRCSAIVLLMFNTQVETFLARLFPGHCVLSKSISPSHCSSFSSSFSKRLNASTSDIDTALMCPLREQCKSDTGNDNTVVQDIKTPNKVDNRYYKNVLSHDVLFDSDATLMVADDTSAAVCANAKDNGVWEEKFKAAMVRMGAIEVKTSANGEIRRKCGVVNSY